MRDRAFRSRRRPTREKRTNNGRREHDRHHRCVITGHCTGMANILLGIFKEYSYLMKKEC